MSNYLAIAAATAAIKQLLDAGLRDEGMSGITISAKPPDTVDSSVNTLNIFLYQVSRNVAYENADLPTRNSNGDLTNVPRVALDLNYLITAYAANSDDLYSQMILAAAIQTLHEQPILTPSMIPIVITTNAGIIDSNVDLAQQPELVKITPQNLSLEEITKLWSSFFQTNYRLSVFYRATVVLLDREQELTSPLPVKDVGVYALPLKRPMIDEVSPQIVDLRTSNSLTLSGRNLRAEMTDIKLDEAIIDPANIISISSTQIIVQIPKGLPAGMKQIQVLQPLNIGKPQVKHEGFESNIAVFVLAPVITKNDLTTPARSFDVNRGDNLVLNFQPDVIENQKISVFFDDKEVLSVSVDVFSWEDVPDIDTSKIKLFLSSNFDEVRSWIGDPTITKPDPNTINAVSSDGTASLSIALDMANKKATLTILGGAVPVVYVLSAKKENGKTNIYNFLNTLSVTISSQIPIGKHLLRMRIDGADSSLTTDASGKFTGPLVNVF